MAQLNTLTCVAPLVPRLTLEQFNQLPLVHQEALIRWTVRVEAETTAGDDLAALKAGIGLMTVTVMCLRFLDRLYALNAVAVPSRRRPSLWRRLGGAA